MVEVKSKNPGVRKYQISSIFFLSFYFSILTLKKLQADKPDSVSPTVACATAKT